MGHEIVIEVVSESEALELCNSLGYEFKGYEYGSNGKLFLRAVDNNLIFQGNHEKKKDNTKFVVFTRLNGDYMYLADKRKCNLNVTFDLYLARTFSADEAKEKATFMSMKGRHNWQCMKAYN